MQNLQIFDEYATNISKLSEGFAVNRLAPAKTSFRSFQSRRPKAERYEGGFMAKNGPTIIFDHNFRLNQEELLTFIEYCRQWARQLYDVIKGVSLKFEDDQTMQRACFMWQNIPFVQLFPSQVNVEQIKQYCSGLIDGNLNSRRGSYYPMESMWHDVFLPNLLAAIERERNRLTNLEQNLKTASVDGPPPINFNCF